MKKTLIIFAVAIALLVGGLIGFAAMNANSLIAEHKPEIERIASQALGTPVQLGEISTSIIPHTSINVKEVLVGSDGSERFTLKNVALHISLLQLLKKSLHISTLELKAPELTVVKSADGVQIPGMPKRKQNAEPPSQNQNAQPQNSQHESATPSSSPISIVLENFEISEGKILFDDRVTKRQFSLEDISLTSKLGIDSALMQLTNTNIRGNIQGSHPLEITIPSITVDPQQVSAQISDATLSIADSVIKINAQHQKSTSLSVTSESFDIGATLPILKDMGFDFTSFGVDGSLVFQSKLTMQEQGDFGVEADGSFTGTLRGAPVELTTRAHMTKDELSIPELRILAYSGEILAPTTLTFGETLHFSTQPTVTGLQIDQAMEYLTPGTPSKLFGTVQSVRGSLQGSLGANLMQSLQGAFTIDIQNGGLRGVNIAGMALKSAKDIPFIAGALYTHVGPEFRAALDTDNTEFSSLTGKLQLSGGTMRASQMKITSATYTIDSDGTLGFDSTVDMNSTLSFTREFSEALVRSAKDFEKILTAEGTLVIPLTIQGALPKVVIIPNLSKVIEIAAKRALKDKAGEFVGKALGEKAGGLLKGFGF